MSIRAVGLGALTEAAQAYFDAYDEWFQTVNARPFDADVSARAAIARTDAQDRLRDVLANLPTAARELLAERDRLRKLLAEAPDTVRTSDEWGDSWCIDETPWTDPVTGKSYNGCQWVESRTRRARVQMVHSPECWMTRRDAALTPPSTEAADSPQADSEGRDG